MSEMPKMPEAPKLTPLQACVAKVVQPYLPLLVTNPEKVDGEMVLSMTKGQLACIEQHGAGL